MNNIELMKEIKKRLVIELDKHDRGGIYGYTQRTLAYNSNRIEGSTLTEKQTASIFETGTLMGDNTIFRTKDVEEMTGHFTMFNYMLKTYEYPMTEELMKEYHYKLKAGVFEDLANGYPIGAYKNRKNMVSDIETVVPEDVPEAINNLISNYEKIEHKSIEDIARFHAEFEKIHPFQDGNGRVGRMLIFKECLRQNIIPVIIESDRKAEYYHYLNQAQQKEDYGNLCKIFTESQDRYAEKVEGFLETNLEKAE